MKINLGNNLAMWPQQIFDYISIEVPYIVPYIESLDFKKINIVQGVAMGGISLKNQASGVMAVVPITVENFELSPFDIMILETDLYVPLSETRVIEHLGPSLGKTYKKNKYSETSSGGKMPVTTSPPGHSEVSGGSRKFASLFVHASANAGFGPGVLKIIMDSMPGLKESDAVAKRIKTVIRDLPYRVIWIHYDAMNQNWVAMASDDSYRITKIVGRDAILKEFSRFDANLDSEMTLRDHIFISKNNQKPLMMNDIYQSPEVLRGSGLAALIDKEMCPRIGQFYNRVTDLYGSGVGLNLWFNGEFWALSEEMTGYPLRDGQADRVVTITPGNKYCFSYVAEDREYSCTLPFEILEEPIVSGGNMKIKARNFYGKETLLVYTKDTDAPIGDFGQKNDSPETLQTIYIPTSWKLHLVGNKKLVPLYITDETIKNKIALSENVITVSKDDGDIFISGPYVKGMISPSDGIESVSCGKRTRNQEEAVWILMNLGFTEGDAKMILTNTLIGEQATVVGNALPWRSVSSSIQLPSHLVHVASSGVMDDSSIDSILGLGMVDMLTEEELAEHVDEIKKLEGLLAKFLFFARIGSVSVDIETLQKALRYVSEVLDQVESYSSSVGRKEEKGA